MQVGGWADQDSLTDHQVECHPLATDNARCEEANELEDILMLGNDEVDIKAEVDMVSIVSLFKIRSDGDMLLFLLGFRREVMILDNNDHDSSDGAVV